MKILAIDLGKERSVVCDYERELGTYEFVTVPSSRAAFDSLVHVRRPQRVVIEICAMAGWVCDVIRPKGIEVQVVKTTEQAWRWRHIKRKTDRDDALKLAQFSSMNQLKFVHVPELRTRQWRSAIACRFSLVSRRTQVKNRIRSLLAEQALTPAYRTRMAWTKAHQQALREIAKPLHECAPTELWKGELQFELDLLSQFDQLVQACEAELDRMGAEDHRVRLLRTIPGVGPRLAETLVATIDDPHRFSKGKQLSCYAGLSPRQIQSGQTDRRGRISGAGSAMLRSLLVEVSWMGLRYNGWLRGIFDRVSHGSKARRKLAIVAVARHLLICAWAMLRDDRPWNGVPLEDTLKKSRVQSG